MSQHGYAYRPPEGYYHPQPQPNENAPYAPYNSSVYPPSDLRPEYSYTHDNATQHAFEYNRNAIPGLGMSFAQGTTQWQQPWATPSGVAPAQISAFSDAAPQELGGAPNSIQHGFGTSSHPRVEVTKNDAMEEGELSEGETEDLYEPREPDDIPDLVQSANHVTHAHHQAAGVSASEAPEYSAMDRSGSYSPYLSSQEVDDGEVVETEAASQENPTTAIPITNQPSPVDPTKQAGRQSLAEARKQAQDAILRLWPLNVRYDDYLNEGIDAPTLQELFRDLGLDIASLPNRSGFSSEAISPKPPTPTTRVQSPHPKEKEPAEPVESKAEKAQEPTKNLAEERKDRIARLLAAKGSKQMAASPEAITKSTSSSASQSSAPMKPQSDKSRLLQQKMEALIKSREARSQKPNQEQDQNDGVQSDLQNGDAVPSTDAVPSPPSSGQEPTQKQSLQGTDAQSASSIPGLFMSSTPKPSPSTALQKRPLASDLNEPMEGPFKRPFGQSRESQPFLIDVSDDEDDAAMDLDSPELRPTPVQKPGSPFKITPYRDLQAAPSNQSTRRVSSPIPTPPITGKGDLESMNKEIEAMKRKIAEAEARKRAKLSGLASPSLEQTNGRMGLQSTASSVPPPQLEETPAQSTGRPLSEAHDSSTQMPIHSPSQPQRMPRSFEKGSSERRVSRSRSRAASERLPVIEALRKEQLLKLQALQSQVKRIESEIAESLREEERLKTEAAAGLDPDVEENLENLPTQAEQMSLPAEGAHVSPVEVATDQPPSTDPRSELDGQAVNGSGEHVESSSSSEEASDSRPQPLSQHQPDNLEQADESYAEPEYEPQLPEAQAPQYRVVHTPAVGEADESESVDMSDGYEPPEADSSTSAKESDGSPFDALRAESGALAETSDNEAQGVSTTIPITQPISTGQQESKPASPREDDETQSQTQPAEVSTASSTGFVPYESPLKYFRAYRFHPRFNDAVPGGLRSLTYSNKIDVKKELCPDQLAGIVCPRGDQCEFQHFEAMQAPDDQILLQLGAYGNYEGEQKQEYINGLRQLLTDFRNRKIKDFKTISQGILDYRAQFRKDSSKILPLGDVSI